jgi:hypothetical protein
MDDASELLLLAVGVLLVGVVANRLVRAWGELAEARRRRARQPV